MAATKSGSGKTLLTVGIMAALVRRGLTVAPFKCGPDFIDPTVHRLVVDRISDNLDLFMMGEDCCRRIFARSAGQVDVRVVEGVMGLFDGGGASTAALAKALGLPVLLIVDARSAAESVAAVVKGFEVFDPAVRLCGVVLNQTGSERHVALIRDALADSCRTPYLGAFPRDRQFAMPERHLGLHMGEENPLSTAQLDRLAAAIEEHIDMTALLAASEWTQTSSQAPEKAAATAGRRLRLAIARDAAFCFYYQENLELLAAAGFDPVFFSPLTDTALPQGTAAVYIGGGYPELHAARLAANEPMKTVLRQWVADGGLLYCECGGLMYMAEELADTEGQVFPMVGVFPLHMAMRPRFSRLGYRRVRLRRDCFLGRESDELFGHEFHYSEPAGSPPELECLYTLEDGRQEGYARGNAIGSYVHLHFGRAGGNADHFFHYALNLQTKKEGI
ncbi:MAG: cobyrinate a,c-diamide synthase [Leptonema illini]|uniref:Cobyrinate a,c-diamide synthase n=1 Tax=Leptonema illini TaxID=183 RepID=A0A833GVI2_9LEPT|nr:MAG: cobyrinate a,c-diamide synthase [Leptonema illini]